MKLATIPIAATLLVLLCGIPAAGQDKLLIIAPNEYLDALAPLKRFKDASCRPTWLVGLNQVYESYAGADEAEKVKRCIEQYHSSQGVTHVLLAGNIEKFPARFRWWGRYMPNDPYFRGTWYVYRGEYNQSNETDGKPFCSWVNVGGAEYTIDVDCKTVSGDAAGRQFRLYYADAERPDSPYRIEFRPTQVWLVACGTVVTREYNFFLNTSYHVTIALQAERVVVSVNGHELINQPLGAGQPSNRGKIGLGTWLSHSVFDNLSVTSGGTTLLSENFDDGVANGFTDTTTMEERGWAVSDLYYANLYRPIPDWPYQGFDTWDGNHNGLYGEIEWNPDPNNCAPNCKALNNDQIGYLANVAVGRVPAATAAEVTCYVNKVLLYEMGARADASWFRKASLYEGATGDEGKNNNIQTYLQSLGFTVSNRRWSELQNVPDRRSIVVNDINAGAGIVNYVGHGDKTEWSCMGFHSADILNSLTNGSQRWQLPIVLASACFTGQFAPLVPSDPWKDKNQQEHAGTSQCEPLPETNPATVAPNCLQPGHAVYCMSNAFLFNGGGILGSGGAIAYLGERSAGRFWCDRLAELFFTAYTPGVTIGQMWQNMIQGYHNDNNLAMSGTWIYDESKWEQGHMFDEPQKLILFADPSLLVGGAFNNYLSGATWDWYGGPLFDDVRYRIIGDVAVPYGYALTAYAGTSVFFEAGRKLTAYDGLPGNGCIVDASASAPVWFMSLGPDPQTQRVLHGIKINGQLRMRNGGQVKLY